MPHNCCVPLCSSDSRMPSCSNVSFHVFPSRDDIRMQWISNTRRKDFHVTKYTVMCSKHFTKDDYFPTVGIVQRKRLKPTAVPTVFPWSRGRPSANAQVQTDDLQSPLRSNHQQCQSLIRVRTTEDHGHLYIKELRDVHNHEPEGDGGKRAKSNNSSSSCVEVSTTSDEISPLENYLQVVTASHSFDPSPFETLSAVSSSKPYELPSSGGGDPSADALQHLQMQHAEEVHRAQMIQLQRSIQLAEDEHQARMELIRRKLEVADLKFEYWTEQRKLQQKQ